MVKAITTAHTVATAARKAAGTCRRLSLVLPLRFINLPPGLNANALFGSPAQQVGKRSYGGGYQGEHRNDGHCYGWGACWGDIAETYGAITTGFALRNYGECDWVGPNILQ